MFCRYRRRLGAIVVVTLVLTLPTSASSDSPAGQRVGPSACRPTACGDSGVPTPAGWNFLENSYWYVPTPNLPALLSTTAGGGTFAPISDQTVFFIQHYAAGYFWGVVATEFTLDPNRFGPNCFQLVGSVTPEGTVNLAFTPTGSSGTPTAGFGIMRRIDGRWKMENQMSTGTSEGRVTHWAYMTQCLPGEPCIQSLPGTDFSIAQLIGACS
jgi:hypothetical protein